MFKIARSLLLWGGVVVAVSVASSAQAQLFNKKTDGTTNANNKSAYTVKPNNAAPAKKADPKMAPSPLDASANKNTKSGFSVQGKQLSFDEELRSAAAKRSESGRAARDQVHASAGIKRERMAKNDAAVTQNTAQDNASPMIKMIEDNRKTVYKGNEKPNTPVRLFNTID
jgi:hypothetical protein